MALHNDCIRYNQQMIDLFENLELQQQILDDLGKGYSRRATAERNGINPRKLRILMKHLGIYVNMSCRKGKSINPPVCQIDVPSECRRDII